MSIEDERLCLNVNCKYFSGYFEGNCAREPEEFILTCEKYFPADDSKLLEVDV